MRDQSNWLTRCRLWLLRCDALDRSQPEFLLLCLVLFDAMVTVADIQAAWQSLAAIYRDGEEVCLEWFAADGRQDRRILSGITVLSHAAQRRTPPPFDVVALNAMSKLRLGIDRTLHRDATPVPASFDELLDWVQQALLMELSGDTFAHVRGLDRLTALPRSCLARRRVRLALRIDDVEPTVVHDEASMLLMDVIGQVASDSDQQCIELLCKACKNDLSEPNAVEQRRRMLLDLQSLATRCAASGHWPSVLLLWAMNLVRVGTLRRRPLKPSTIEPYVHLVAIRLWKLLRDQPIDRPGQIQWQQLYETILADPEIELSQRGKAAAALTSFHEFAEQLIDAPRLQTALDPEQPLLAPRANVFWPHEWHFLLDRLAETAPDDRLARQLEAVTALLAGACLRISDAWHVHVCGVQFFDDVVIVSIDPLPSVGTGKSASARRQVQIRDERCCRVLSAWHQRRDAEGAYPRDLLFGDPADPRRPWRGGATAFLLNGALKSVTGDPDVGTHTFRHAAATFGRESAADGDTRRMDQLSALAGHASTRTTFVNYVHHFEPILRAQLDRSIRRLRLTEAQICRLTGTQPGWLRKRWQRSETHRTEIAWAGVEEMAGKVDMPDVADGLVFGPPRIDLAKPAAEWSFAMVLEVLCDVADGFTPHQVQLRRGLTSAQWHAVDSVVSSWGGSPPGRTPERREEELPWRHGFARVGQNKWRPVMETLLGVARPDDVRAMCAAWQLILCRDYLSLADMAVALPFLQWLAATGIPASHLVVSTEAGSSKSQLTIAVDAIGTLFGGQPRLRVESPRRARPPIYLMVSSGNTDGPSNAALSVAGLHALVFSAWVWTRLGEGAR
jgi:integrase